MHHEGHIQENLATPQRSKKKTLYAGLPAKRLFSQHASPMRGGQLGYPGRQTQGGLSRGGFNQSMIDDGRMS